MRMIHVQYTHTSEDSMTRPEKTSSFSMDVDAQDIAPRMARVRRLVTLGAIHSVSAFDVTDGARENVTAEFVTFHSRRAHA